MLLPIEYLRWHYSGAFIDMLRVWRNLFLFLIDFFSIPLLLRTLLSPWRRLREERRHGFDLADFFSVLIVNIVTRIVGAMIRTVIIVIGLFWLTLLLVGGILFVALWMVAPIVIVFGLVRGFSLLL